MVPARRAPHRAVRLTAPTQVTTCLDVLAECCSAHKTGYLCRSVEHGQGNGAGACDTSHLLWMPIRRACSADQWFNCVLRS